MKFVGNSATSTSASGAGIATSGVAATDASAVTSRDGAIGAGYFIYGKNQKSPVPLVCGVALFIFPYFVPNAWLLVLIGLAIMAVPYFWRP